MIVPKEHRNLVYAYLFREGVMVAKKDFFAPKHHLISQVGNRELIQLMKSLKSRSYIKETFSWGWYYWTLTEEGITYLRGYLHLPEEVVPNTMKARKTEVDHERRPVFDREDRPRFRREGGRGGFRGGRGGRGGFRGERAPRPTATPQ